jgi:hypothetical protein
MPWDSDQARIAALTRSAQEPSGAAMTETAREAFVRSFYEATDSALPERERKRQSEAALKLHMLKLSRLAAAARQRKREQAAAVADGEQAGDSAEASA